MRELHLCILAMALARTVTHASAPTATTSPLPPGVMAGPAIEGIQSYTLANELTVLPFPGASKATVTVNLTYRAGSLQENYGEAGIAHLLEHLMFRELQRIGTFPVK